MISTDFIKGVIVPIITPIDEDERIDEARLRRQVDFVIKGGLHGILAFGSNGEFYQLEADEMRRGLQIMVDQAGFPYILASAPSTPRNAAAWQRWRWKTALWACPFSSPCF